MYDFYTVRTSFETFKSNVCHRLKSLGDLEFIVEILKSNNIIILYNKNWQAEALYLLAMLDYLCRINDLPQCENYNTLRCLKLKEIIYPSSVYCQYLLTKDENILKECF